MLTLHPEEPRWLDEYRQVLNERHPGTVLRMVVCGRTRRSDRLVKRDVVLAEWCRSAVETNIAFDGEAK